jgi:hypothetical protein
LPQPLVIGDPAAYLDIGRRFAAALAELRGPRGVADLLQTLRPYGGLGATGLLYGLLLLIHDSLRTIYVAHALAMAGAVTFLVRRPRGSAGAGSRRSPACSRCSIPRFPSSAGSCSPSP